VLAIGHSVSAAVSGAHTSGQSAKCAEWHDRSVQTYKSEQQSLFTDL